MKDLATATERLKQSSDSLVVVKGGQIILSSQRGGIRPLFDAVTDLGENMKGSCVADKVIGKAAAALCVSAGVRGVHTPVMSLAAQALLADRGILYTTDQLVAGILNKNKSDLCPLEKLTVETDCLEEIADIVKQFLIKPLK